MACGDDARLGVPLFRQNPKGGPGIWACRKHSQEPIAPEVERVTSCIARYKGRESRPSEGTQTIGVDLGSKDETFAFILHPEGDITDLQKPFCRECGSNNLELPAQSNSSK
jgi:hypothetical protein